MNKTPEQEAILDFATSSRDNLMIRAYAGTGKTTMLEQIDAIDRKVPHLYLCFNKSIAEEAKTRMLPSTTTKTFNGLGHSIWAEAIGKRKLALETRKIADIFKAVAEQATKGERNELWKAYDAVLAGCDMARAMGYIPAGHAKADKALCVWADVNARLDEPASPYLHRLVDRLLTESIRQAYEGIIDFADQLYMPALFGGAFPRFPLVLIDEWQDLSPVQIAMVAKMKFSRIIGVGDEAQSIYGFRGADHTAMPSAIERFSMSVLPLSVSFRCPESIVDNVRWRVPQFRAHNQGGVVSACQSQPDWPPSSAIICRNNAPLMSLSMRLLHEGHPVSVSGADAGPKVIRLMGRLGPEDMTQAQVLDAIDDWHASRPDSKSAADTAECMRVFARQAKSLGTAIAYARHLFAQSNGTFHFMTGHKAKGLEFDRVYHLDSFLLRDDEQDRNLRYVIDTRPKESLTYIETKYL